MIIDLKELEFPHNNNDDDEISLTEVFITSFNKFYNKDIKIDVDDTFDGFIKFLETTLELMETINIDNYIRELLLGNKNIPLPSDLDYWEVNELKQLNKRDKINRKLNKLTK